MGPKLTAKHLMALASFIRSTLPFHAWGQQSENVDKVERKMDEFRHLFKLECQGTVDKEELAELLENYRITFLCRARKELFNALPDWERLDWIQRICLGQVEEHDDQ